MLDKIEELRDIAARHNKSRNVWSVSSELRATIGMMKALSMKIDKSDIYQVFPDVDVLFIDSTIMELDTE